MRADESEFPDSTGYLQRFLRRTFSINRRQTNGTRIEIIRTARCFASHDGSIRIQAPPELGVAAARPEWHADHERPRANPSGCPLSGLPEPVHAAGNRSQVHGDQQFRRHPRTRWIDFGREQVAVQFGPTENGPIAIAASTPLTAACSVAAFNPRPARPFRSPRRNHHGSRQCPEREQCRKNFSARHLVTSAGIKGLLVPRSGAPGPSAWPWR